MYVITSAGIGGIKSAIRNTVFLCLIIMAGGRLSAFAEQNPSNGTAGNTTIGWPVLPEDPIHIIGNAHGSYQCFNEGNCNPYYHPGIDIMAPAGTPVYAVKSGYVKVLISYTGGDSQWRLVIGDSAGTQECDAWRYDHMDPTSIPHMVGDTIEAGQFLGNLITWDPTYFSHVHFTQIHCQGDSAAWADKSQWRYISNALDLLDPITDTVTPIIENAFGSDMLAFAANNTDSYFSSGESLSGDVDIICKTHDFINHDSWKVSPYKIEYTITGDSIIPWLNSVCFTGEVFSIITGTGKETDIIYQDDAVCNTQCDYNARNFYFNITNTDGDSTLETSDKDYCWQTPFFHNGQYTVSVRAYDAYGNMAMESMDVSVENYFELSGTILLGDKQGLDQTVVTVVSSGQSDTTDSDGYFNIPGVGGGSQLVEIRQGGYEPVDTVVMMSQNQQLDLTLTYFYTCGDANGDAGISVADAVYVINYVFKGGPAPDPLQSGDANCDGTVNVSDAVYVITYVFKGGPEPCCP